MRRFYRRCRNITLILITCVAKDNDGATAISSRLNNVQAIKSEQYPTTMYLHCMSYSLNPAISDSVESHSIRNCFGVVQKVVVFFNTPKRKEALFQT